MTVLDQKSVKEGNVMSRNGEMSEDAGDAPGAVARRTHQSSGCFDWSAPAMMHSHWNGMGVALA